MGKKTYSWLIYVLVLVKAMWNMKWCNKWSLYLGGKHSPAATAVPPGTPTPGYKATYSCSPFHQPCKELGGWAWLKIQLRIHLPVHGKAFCSEQPAQGLTKGGREQPWVSLIPGTMGWAGEEQAVHLLLCPRARYHSTPDRVSQDPRVLQPPVENHCCKGKNNFSIKMNVVSILQCAVQFATLFFQIHLHWSLIWLLTHSTWFDKLTLNQVAGLVLSSLSTTLQYT